MTDKEFKKIAEESTWGTHIAPSGNIIKSRITPRLTRRILKLRKAEFKRQAAIYKKLVRRSNCKYYFV